MISASLISACSNFPNQSLDGQRYTINTVEGSSNLHLESENFSGIIFSANNKKYGHRSGTFTPTTEEIFKAEQIFKEYLDTGKKDSNGIKVDKKRIKPLTDYYRQYVGLYNENGEKTIYFSCFTKSISRSISNWKNEELTVRDGGNSYFSIVINLKTESCLSFMINGIA